MVPQATQLWPGSSASESNFTLSCFLWIFLTSAMVAQPAEKSCGESVQPFLASILEELMGPVSSGFGEVRALFEKEVDELSQSFHGTKDGIQLKEVRPS